MIRIIPFYADLQKFRFFFRLFTIAFTAAHFLKFLKFVTSHHLSKEIEWSTVEVWKSSLGCNASISNFHNVQTFT